MSVNLRATEPIPAIGAEPGDSILVEPDHPTNPLLVIKGYDRTVCDWFVLTHAADCRLVAGSLEMLEQPTSTRSAPPHRLRVLL